MRRLTDNTGLVFAGVVTFLMLLLGWWIFFLIRESVFLDQASEFVAQNRYQEALRVLGADIHGSFEDKAHRFRLMFTLEGITMVLFVLLGVFLLYRALRRESRLRMEQHRFLTGATHRLKTPLATIRLGIESIQAGSMPEVKRERYLQAMLREVDRLEQDLTNLLTAGGLESSGAGLRLTPGDLAADVRRAASAMEDRFSTALVRLDVQVRGPLEVARDPSAVGLILHNLLDNAVKHSEADTTVTLRVEPRAGHAEIVVEDEGPGIDPEDLPRVFERFYSGRGSEVKGGSGLGLFLVRELVQAHDGSVDVRNRTDRSGTVVTVLLPLAEVLA